MNLEQVRWKDKRGYHGYVKVRGGAHVDIESVENPITVLTPSSHIPVDKRRVKNALEMLNKQRREEQKKPLQFDELFYAVSRLPPLFGPFKMKKDELQGYGPYSVSFFRKGE